MYKLFFSLAVLCLTFTLFAEEAATQPAVIPVSDTAKIKENTGKTITVEGVIESAKWSNSGKVMNIFFKEADNGLLAVVFEKNKDKVNAAFKGDAATAWTGAKVQLTGKVETYGGHSEKMKDRPQIIIDKPDQVKVIEEAK